MSTCAQSVFYKRKSPGIATRLLAAPKKTEPVLRVQKETGWGSRSHPTQYANASLLGQVHHPNAASVRCRIENARSCVDGQPRDFNIRQAASGHYPGGRAKWEFHHAEVGSRVEIAIRVLNQRRDWEVRQIVADIRPGCGCSAAIADIEYVTRLRRCVHVVAVVGDPRMMGIRRIDKDLTDCATGIIGMSPSRIQPGVEIGR